MTNNERFMTDFTANLHDAIDLRLVEDREPDLDPDPLYGLPFQGIVEVINFHAEEEYLEWQEREALRWERHDEYWA